MHFHAGDHLKVSRIGYTHHGIYVGAGQVVHFSGELGSKANAVIRRDSLEVFTGAGRPEQVRYARTMSGCVIVKRALSRLGEAQYDLVFNNCEHFARWCATGKHASEQIKDLGGAAGGAGGATIATGAALGGVAALGTAAGVSGAASTMSGLASAGALVGGGAVAGVAVLATAPAAIATCAMRMVLCDDDALPEAERASRKLGRMATVGGAAIGTVGTIATISATGTVAGLSGAGITSGFLAMGTTVGGGMAAGVTMAVAAPAVVAAAAGYAAYRLLRWWRGAGR